MQVGFGKVDITPRVGVELQGYGPFLCRHSTAVRDRLYARAMALRDGDKSFILVSCDLIGLRHELVAVIRERISVATGLERDQLMVHCIHTHSGPATASYHGWGEPDPPYVELLPARLTRACLAAWNDLAEAEIAHAAVPCEGIGINREYDAFSAPLEEMLDERWRPAKPELTDTACHVVTVRSNGELRGFFSYFGCHPVVGGSGTRQIHGDYAGVATNLLEREHPGVTGLFLQGAQGDVNAAIVAQSEPEAMRALDVLASRYARSVRKGITAANPIEPAPLAWHSRGVEFSRKNWDEETLRRMLAEQQAIFNADDATDLDQHVRMAMVKALAVRKLLNKLCAGEPLVKPIELHGLRIGPLTLLGTPFEVQQAIKNEVVEKTKSPIPLLMGLTNDTVGYAPDRTVAKRGGYAADTVPLIIGELPFANVHEELVAALLEIDALLNP